MIVSKSHNRFRIGAKSASGAPGPKSAPRGSTSTTFGKGIFQSFNLEICNESNKGLPFYPFNIRYAYDSKLQLEKFSESEVGAL